MGSGNFRRCTAPCADAPAVVYTMELQKIDTLNTEIKRQDLCRQAARAELGQWKEYEQALEEATERATRKWEADSRRVEEHKKKFLKELECVRKQEKAVIQQRRKEEIEIEAMRASIVRLEKLRDDPPPVSPLFAQKSMGSQKEREVEGDDKVIEIVAEENAVQQQTPIAGKNAQGQIVESGLVLGREVEGVVLSEDVLEDYSVHGRKSVEKHLEVEKEKKIVENGGIGVCGELVGFGECVEMTVDGCSGVVEKGGEELVVANRVDGVSMSDTVAKEETGEDPIGKNRKRKRKEDCEFQKIAKEDWEFMLMTKENLELREQSAKEHAKRVKRMEDDSRHSRLEHEAGMLRNCRSFGIRTPEDIDTEIERLQQKVEEQQELQQGGDQMLEEGMGDVDESESVGNIGN